MTLPIEQGSSTTEKPQTPTVTVTSHFKMIWLTIVSITSALIILDILLSVLIKNPTDAVKNAIDMCDNLAKAGIGAIFGMLGGKVA